MTRFYCENCGTEFKFVDTVWKDEYCPVCGFEDDKLTPIPNYETPAQYEKRYPDEKLEDAVHDFAAAALNEKWECDFGEPMRWIHESDVFRCPKCGADVCVTDIDGNWQAELFLYCPSCAQRLKLPIG